MTGRRDGSGTPLGATGDDVGVVRDFSEQRRGHGGFWPGLLVTLILLTGVLLLSPSTSTSRIRSLLGLDDQRLHSVVSPHGHGAFRFEVTQPGTKAPVSYNPCRPIAYAIDPQGAPPDYRTMVAEAVARVSDATGFEFTYDGTTDARPFAARGTPSVGRSPVVIGWATPDEMTGLGGDIAGLGGSTAVQRGPDHLTYVTGAVALDRDLFAELARRPHGRAEARAIVMHELGHVVGLGHVDDPGELMYRQSTNRTEFGPGDLEGLAKLGAVDCR